MGDHVGVAKFVMRGFSINNQVFCYNVLYSKSYKISVNKLGTINGYYDREVEQQLLANGIESGFASVYYQILGETNLERMCEITNENKITIQNYLSLMYSRSRVILKMVNDDRKFLEQFGVLTHSNLLVINKKLKNNFLRIIGEEYVIIPFKLLNCHAKIVNNSIGFGISINKHNKISIYFPFNSELLLLFVGVSNKPAYAYRTISSDEESLVKMINEIMCFTEYFFGNGFIFGINQSTVQNCMELFKDIEND